MERKTRKNGRAWGAAATSVALVFAAVLAAGPAAAQDDDELEVEYKISLTGDAERPNPVDTDATGTAEVELKVKGGEVKWLKVEVEVCDIVGAVAAHIHASAGPDAAAGVVLWLYGPGPAVSADDCTRLMKMMWTGAELGDDLVNTDVDGFVEALTTGQAYINVHTQANPGGEIRGQIV